MHGRLKDIAVSENGQLIDSYKSALRWQATQYIIHLDAEPLFGYSILRIASARREAASGIDSLSTQLNPMSNPGG